MRKIINRKMYNTETATRLGIYHICRHGRFNYCKEALYQKKNGEFFLMGKGGAASKYGEQVGTNEWSSGATIIPYSKEEAKDWLKEYGDAEVYRELFENAEP